MRIRVTVALLALAPVLIGASEPIKLQPSSQWAVDYAQNSCRLVRTFGQGDDQTKLVLESVAPGNLVMVVTGRSLATRAGAEDIEARLLPVEDVPFEGTAHNAEAGDPPVLWTYVPVLQFDPQDPPASLLDVKPKSVPNSGVRPAALNLAKRAALQAERQALLEKANELEIIAPHERPVILETASMAAPMKIFDQCDRDLLHDLGLDPAVQDKVVRPLWAPDLTRWLNSNSYPLAVLPMTRESRVSVRLLVDAAGKVTNCTTLSEIDAPELKKAVCDGLSRAHFRPAELGDGAKVPSYFVVDVQFRLMG